MVLGLCLHGIYVACGVSTDGRGRLAAKDRTEGSVRVRDVDSHLDIAGRVSSLCLTLLICKMGYN